MNTCPDKLELSSYLDGESRNAEQIARHIQSCPDCARIHLEMRKVSAHLKNLRAPDVSHAFAEEVGARCEELSRPIAWPRVSTTGLALAASLLVTVGVATVFWLGAATDPDFNRTANQSTLPNPAWENDAELVDALAHLMNDGADLALFSEPDYNLEDDVPEDVSVEQVLEALAEDVPADLIDTDEPEDFAMLLDELAAMDVQSLAELLEIYESEG